MIRIKTMLSRGIPVVGSCIILTFLFFACEKQTIPEVIISGIENGESYYRGDTLHLELKFDGSDKFIDKVTYSINAEKFSTLKSAPYTYDWAVTNGVIGENFIVICVYDEDGEFEQYDFIVKVYVNEMIFVEGGSFAMGCEGEEETCEDTELPVHQVQLSDFYISKYEVSISEFLTFLNDVDYHNEDFEDPEYGDVNYYSYYDARITYNDDVYIHDPNYSWLEDPDEMPMTGVTWFGANAYCKWLGGRLPSEAEWEFAARGGVYSNGYLYAGSDDLIEVGWIVELWYTNAKEKGLKQPNELGIYDMSGNVRELCNDNYDPWYYEVSPSVNPTGSDEETEYKSLRGGGVNSYMEYCTVFARTNVYWHSASSNTGFRIASDQKIL